MILLQTVVSHLQSRTLLPLAKVLGNVEIVNNIFLFVLFYIVLGFIVERLAFARGIYRHRPVKTTLKY